MAGKHEQTMATVSSTMVHLTTLTQSPERSQLFEFDCEYGNLQVGSSEFPNDSKDLRRIMDTTQPLNSVRQPSKRNKDRQYLQASNGKHEADSDLLFPSHIQLPKYWKRKRNDEKVLDNAHSTIRVCQFIDVKASPSPNVPVPKESNRMTGEDCHEKYNGCAQSDHPNYRKSGTSKRFMWKDPKVEEQDGDFGRGEGYHIETFSYVN